MNIVATGNVTATGTEIETETETAEIGIVMGIEVVVGETTVNLKVVDHRGMMMTGVTTGAEGMMIPLNLGKMVPLVRGGEGEKRTILLSEGLRRQREQFR